MYLFLVGEALALNRKKRDESRKASKNCQVPAEFPLRTLKLWRTVGWQISAHPIPCPPEPLWGQALLINQAPFQLSPGSCPRIPIYTMPWARPCRWIWCDRNEIATTHKDRLKPSKHFKGRGEWDSTRQSLKNAEDTWKTLSTKTGPDIFYLADNLPTFSPDSE